jgi:8-amino-7-oxononanoate synthase
VPEASSRIRTSYMATHTEENLERILDAFRKVGRELGIIP